MHDKFIAFFFFLQLQPSDQMEHRAFQFLIAAFRGALLCDCHNIRSGLDR